MKTRSMQLSKRFRQRLIIATLVAPAFATMQAGNTWDGGGTTDNWSDAANWNPDGTPGYGTVTFSGSTRTSPILDSNVSMNQLDWTGSSAWTLGSSGGSVLSLYDFGGTQSKIENHGSGLVVIDAPITFAATTGANFGEINAVGGGFTFGSGTLAVSGSAVSDIRLYGSGQVVTFNNTVSASGRDFGIANSGGGNTVNIGGSFTADNFSVMNGSTLNLNAGGSLNATGVRLGADYVGSGNLDNTLGATFQLTSSTGGQTFAGVVNTESGNTSGALAVSSQNTSGTNTLSGHIALDSNLAINQAAGGTLAITQARALSGDTITGFDLKNKALTIDTAGTVQIGPASPGSTSFGTIYNSTAGGSIVKDGSGTLFLNDNANSYSGGTIINAGVVSVGTMGATGNGGITFNGGTLAVTDAGSASSNRAFSLNSTGTIETTGGTKTFSGAFTGAGGLTKKGAGVMTLSGASNSYAGATTIDAGTLRLSSGNDRLPTGTNLKVNAGATLDLNAVNQTVAQLNDGTGGGGVIANVGGGLTTLSTLTVTGGGSFSGSINDGASTRQTALTKTTGGVLTLSGVSNYTGATTVSGGTLKVDNNGTSTLGKITGSSAAASIAVNTGGTLLLAGSGTADRISNSAGITLGGGTFSIAAGSREGAAATVTGGTVSGASAGGLGALTLSGSSTLDFDSLGSGTLMVFGSFSPGAFTLNISGYSNSNYDGSLNSGLAADDRLVFQASLTPSQLAAINFGSGFTTTQMQLDSGFYEVGFTAVPEAGTLFGAGALLGLAGVRRRRPR